MTRSAWVHLAFLLVIYLTAVSTQSASKPGTCPTVPPGTAGACAEFCSSDNDCDGDAKCCSNGCGHSCRSPVNNQEIVRGKPGTCPKVKQGTIGTCAESCSSDSDCGENDKCCSNGCGHSCQSPVTNQETANKPGTCPTVPPGTAGACAEFCSSDDDCDGDAKCCSNGCGHSCRRPANSQAEIVRGKPGTCPEVKQGTFGTCVESCSSDSDCGENDKCCSNGCGHSCQSPVTNQEIISKPGSCPKVPKGVFGTCAEYCSSDRDCQGDQKCCSNGCGHSCQRPVNNQRTSCLDPCINSPCSNEERCEAQQVQCIRAPCCPIAKCVKKRYNRSNGKAGSCPAVQGAGVCVTECSSDTDCPGAKKCCRNGCGQVCEDPAR